MYLHYAEALEKVGRVEEAIAAYRQVLLADVAGSYVKQRAKDSLLRIQGD